MDMRNNICYIVSYWKFIYNSEYVVDCELRIGNYF